MTDRKGYEEPGDWVCVRTRYGWEFEGELRMSDSDGVRVFDPVIEEVVRLDHDEIIELADAENSLAEKRGKSR